MTMKITITIMVNNRNGIRNDDDNDIDDDDYNDKVRQHSRFSEQNNNFWHIAVLKRKRNEQMYFHTVSICELNRKLYIDNILILRDK